MSSIQSAFHIFNSLILTTLHGRNYYSQFTDEGTRHGEVKKLAQGNTSPEWLSLDSNSDTQ